MSFGYGFGWALGRIGARAGIAPTITGTAPSLSALTAGSQLSTFVVWGFASTTSLPLTGPVRQMQINDGAWVAYVGTRVLAMGERVAVREVWSDARPSSRSFTSVTQTVPTATVGDFSNDFSNDFAVAA